MPSYALCYIAGPNDSLQRSQQVVVEADSFQQALSTKTSWPVEEDYKHSTASAQNPGTCMYYQELWEATLTDDSPLP